MEEIPISIKSENLICHQEKVEAGTGFSLKAQLSTVKQGSGSHSSGGCSLNRARLRDHRGDNSSSQVKGTILGTSGMLAHYSPNDLVR